ncbi:family A G protein-coupled receptor-like protein [Choiromyces venosus 120613-1]|uniref:Family A G protein-coupled receptor-like protein n=1 Tax=Choiromyces venosus 120613-1 TaxID=1336337 RepID=A0A3N4IWI3_9PEZI|nr:family A G protein-coupled receptor-like protein [Choiromyces venosus 120613-1]
MAWTTLQLEILQTTSRVSSVFSLLGASFIIITFCTSTSFHKPINRLAFFAAFGNILTNVATITSRKGIEHGNQSALCRIQATFIQWFMPADALFCLAMALNVYLTVFKKYTTKRLRGLEFTYILVCYGLPAIPAITFLFIKNREGVYIYGSAILWCWISAEWQFLRIAGFYGPVWIILGVTIVIYILAGRVIFRLRGSLRNFARRSAPAPPVKDTWSTQRDSLSRAMSPDPTPRPNAANNPLPSYTVVIESGPRPSAANNRVPRNSAVEANTAAWAYCRCAMLFFLALLITWLPSSVNRIYQFIYPDSTHFGLNFAAALVLPCQGFWNGLIYIVTTLPACKEFCRNLWEHIRRPFDRLSAWRKSRRSLSSKANSMNSL